MTDSQNSASALMSGVHLSAEDCYRMLMDYSFDWEFWRLPDDSFAYMPNGSFAYMSPSCVRITGYDAQDFMNNPDLYFDIMHPDDRSRLISHHCQPAKGKTGGLEFRIINKDGTPRWIDHVCRCMYDEQGHFLGCRASNRDVTSRKNAELLISQQAAETQANSRLLQSIVNYTPVGIAVVDAPDMKIRLISKRGCELEGRSREELNQLNAEQYRFLHLDGTPAENWQLPLARAVRLGEQVTDEEWIVLRPDDIRVNILCNAGPVYDESGHITGGVLVWQDITRRKDNERHLEQSRQRLLELKEQLENKNKEMETIIGTVSHDLRSPLVSIHGFSREIQLSIENAVRLIQSVNLTEQQSAELELIFDRDIPECLGYIQTSASAMDQLVKSLVKVARAGMAEVNPERLDMDELLSNVAGSLHFAVKQANVDLQLEPLPDCYADCQQVTQIFANLLDNAVKYRNPEKKSFIRVFGSRQDAFACYTVEDNGIGIPYEFQMQVFDLFSRVPTPQSKGEGIGLAMVKRMVERNNGYIRMTSEPGEGTCFCVCLPESSLENP